MNGDLSLSQALGGLRIANPDDSADVSEKKAEQVAQTSSTDLAEASGPPMSTAGRGPNGSYGEVAERSNAVVHDNDRQQTSMPQAGAHRDTHARPEITLSSYPHTEQAYTDARRPYASTRQTAPAPNGGEAVTKRTSRGQMGPYPPPAAPGQMVGYSGTPAPSASAEDWKDRGAAIGIRREIDATGRSVVRQVKKGVRDFAFGRILGEGSYSTVYLATDRQTLKEYAIKVLEKRHIIKEKKIKYVNIEKDTLNRLTEHPGIVRLYYTFQDEASLYYVLDLCNGGELLGVLKMTGTFDVECVKFYGAQILDSMDYMHSRGVIHRDLKPENVLLDGQMHVKITDFGTAKLLKDPRAAQNSDNTVYEPATTQEEEDRAASFVGTAEYVSPELLTHKSASKASDLWAFGCIIYQLLAGRPPFKAGSEYLTFQKIVNLEYEFPSGFPRAARDLVERCLVLDPARRLTVEHIKNHEFFQGQQFGRSLWKMKAPRLRPYVPPPQEPTIIQLNGFPSKNASNASQTTSHSQATTSKGTPRPSRIITELPPPTQLDIEWSPVLTKVNERILKLADLMVISAPLQNGSNGKAGDEGHKKLSRFFGGSTTKKRQRLVMVTSSGRILLAPAGGDDKRSKQELSLLAPDSSWRCQNDAKGQPVWSFDGGGYHYTFEETKGSSSDSGKPFGEEWIESLERAKHLALSQNSLSHEGEGGFSDMSAVPSPSDTIGARANGSESFGISERPPRGHLTKNQGTSDETPNKRNRFSKRQSRTGIGPAF